MTMTAARFTDLMRTHRRRVGLSQLALALASGVSQRHVSYLEVGKSKPSSGMVCHLSEVMGLELAQTNEMLLAAGFAPRFGRGELGERALALGSRAVDVVLSAMHSYPAFAADADGNVIRHNAAAALFVKMARSLGEPTNLLLATLHPDGWRSMVSNLDEIAPCLLRRFFRERVLGATTPPAVWSRVMELPGVRDWITSHRARDPVDPVVTLDIRIRGERIRWLSMTTTLGTPQDLTLQELRIECFVPADEASSAAWQRLHQSPR
jgi:transcriptional regulator with XRE-family HTH domain